MAKHFQVDTNGTLTTSLVSYYRMEGDSTDYWGSNNGSDSSVSYGSSYGKVNQGAAFNGSYISLGGSYFNPDHTQAFSISLWFKTSTTSNSAFISKQDGNSPYVGWIVMINNGETGAVSCQLYSGSNQQLYSQTSGTSYNNGSWHHLVVTYDGSNSNSGLKLYLDGSLDVGSTSPQGTLGTISTSTPLYVANRYNNSGQNLNGDEDELGLWTKVLSSTEISNLYNGGSGQTMVSSTAYTRTLADSIMLAASPARETTIAYLKGKLRTLTDNIMNAASRSTTLGYAQTLGRGLADSIMNAASRLATVASVRQLARNLADSIMNAANRLTTFSVIAPLWSFAKKNIASWATRAKNAATWAFDTKHDATWTERSKSNPNGTKTIHSD